MCRNKWDDSQKGLNAKCIGVISICPSAHNPLFVITLIHGQYTHTHTHTFLLCYRLWRGRLIPIFNSTQSNTKLRGGLGAGLCCTMLLSGTTLVLNYPPIPHSFSITHWPNKVCFSNKKEQQRNTESQFCATAVPYNPKHCVLCLENCPRVSWMYGSPERQVSKTFFGGSFFSSIKRGDFLFVSFFYPAKLFFSRITFLIYLFIYLFFNPWKQVKPFLLKPK